jgi:redox-sensitive bicupin YhaK (pirin superfamily)
MEAGATWTLPAAGGETVRVLYFFEGEGLLAGETPIPAGNGAVLDAEAELALRAGPGECRFLILQGRPIGEPVAQHGPFVMNTQAEIMQAFAEFQATGFGGWPWPAQGPVHARDMGRFAKFPDGHLERPAALA